MGSVWLADHLRLQSQVAVKFMAPAVADDEVSVRRFKQEARAAAEIRSPNVVQVFDNGTTEDGMLYIVMELLEGLSLDKRVREHGVLSPTAVASVVVQACKALAKAHERGILHRDIKPANVFLLDPNGEMFVKLLDFGVAKFSGEEATNMTAAGNMVGTPAFMSPEQLFHGREVDHRGDLWSVAVVAYYALTGKRPFLGKTLGELCVSIKRGEYAPPSSFKTGLTPELDAWFERAFHDHLERRFQSAKEMAQEIEMACGVSSVMGSTPSAVAPVPLLQTFPGTSVTSQSSLALPPERKRWPIVVAAAAVVAIGIGGTAVLLGGSTETTPAAAPLVQPPTSDGDDEAASATTVADAPDETGTPDDEAGAAGGADGSGGGDAAIEVTVDIARPIKPGARPVPQPAKPKPVTGDSSKPGDDDRSKRAGEELGI
jgi:eukaryotic-like serine/threonine-protein kinase